MCGIAGGAVAANGNLPDRDVLHEMCNLMWHRGPDDEGLHVEPQAFLGMRRLAIIDPAGGQQPLYNEDRTVCAVVNGEIYNDPSLRRELISRGHRFATDSDVECVLHAYEEFGLDGFAELRGMFAAAIWDRNHERLVLARDRFGKKPLFYLQRGTELFFASELKCLLALPDFQAEINPVAVSDYLTLGYVPTPNSMLSGVHKLRPGHLLTFERGRLEERRYWELRFAPKHTLPTEALVDELDAHLHDAVAVRLRSDVPFGAFLSGGIDSSLVVALMAQHLSLPVRTFSIGFADRRFNEADDARRIADFVGTQHHEEILGDEAAELLGEIPWLLDEPLADSSAIPTFLVSRLAAGEVKMVLSGDGGDELFAGYERYARYMQLLQLRRLGADRALRWGRPIYARLPGRLARRVDWVRRRLSLNFPDDYLSGVALSNATAVDALLGPAAAPSRGYLGAAPAFSDAEGEWGRLDRVLAGDIGSYLLDDILAKVDRMSMGNSLEVRSPLLDHSLAEFAARLPEQSKLHLGVGKYLLRQVADRYLPGECIAKPKQGFAVPLAHWLRGDLGPLLQDTLHGRAIRERGLLNAETLQRLTAEHNRGERDHAETLWAALVFELWAQRFLDRRSLAPLRRAG